MAERIDIRYLFGARLSDRSQCRGRRDLWYLRHYDGVAFNSFTGDAVYLGPTFYWKIAPKVLMSAAWETQIAGHEPGVSARLDFTDFSRQRARLLLEFEF
jgi:hypothetical protein